MTMNTLHKWLRLSSVTLICIVLLSGCAGRKQIRGIPLVIQLAQLQLQQDHAVLALRLRNGNDNALTGGRLQFQLSIAGRLFAIYNDTPEFEVISHSAEELRVRVRPVRPEALDELRSMAALGQGNLVWQMDGTLELDQKIPPEFSGYGRLFPVPGRDDLFR